MRVLKFDHETHYPLAAEWWTRHKFGVLPVEFLPKNGLVIEADDGTPVCLGFLYLTDSAMAWIEYIVANPDAPITVRSDAVDLLIESLVNLSKTLGVGCLFTSTTLRGLTKRYEKQGFVIGDRGTTQLVRRV